MPNHIKKIKWEESNSSYGYERFYFHPWGCFGVGQFVITEREWIVSSAPHLKWAVKMSSMNKSEGGSAWSKDAPTLEEVKQFAQEFWEEFISQWIIQDVLDQADEFLDYVEGKEPE